MRGWMGARGAHDPGEEAPTGAALRGAGRRLPALLLIGALACDGAERERGPHVTASDSAGVELVYTDLAVGEPPVIAVREALRIGSLDGPRETQLFTVRRVVAAEDGAIHVALLRAGEIRVFDADGRHLRTLGRAGEGPGEFRGLATLQLVGDTIVALDGALRRATTLTRSGEVVATDALPTLEGTPFTFTPVARFDDGWIVSVPRGPEWPEHGQPAERRSAIAIVAGTRAVGEALRRAAAASGAPGPVIELAQGRDFGMTMGGPRTLQRPLWEPAQQWAADDRGWVYATALDEYRIDVHDPSGRLVRRIRRSHRAVPITSELKRRYLDAVVAHYDSAPARTEFGTDPVETQRFRADLPHAPHLPALGRLFDAAGVFLGTMVLPAGFTPHGLARDAVLGVGRDELGVEYVVRLAFDASPFPL